MKFGSPGIGGRGVGVGGGGAGRLAEVEEVAAGLGGPFDAAARRNPWGR